jgi:hypothetical protein
MRRMTGRPLRQLLVDTERPVPPKPPRGTLGTEGRVEGPPGRVAGMVEGAAVVVRVKRGLDQVLLLLVRVQWELQGRRGEQRSVGFGTAPFAASVPGTAGAAVAGGLPGCGQSRGVTA